LRTILNPKEMRPLLPGFLILCACSAEQPPAQTAAADSSVSTAQAASPAADTSLIRGTPPGELEDWVAYMRAGLDSAATQVKTDRAAAHKRVLDLYVTRQEYAEMYYGANGRLEPAPELAEAIVTAEERLHELMLLTGASPPADEGAIRKAIGSAQQQLARVAELAKGVKRRVHGADTTEAAQ
jgi:hypothetical protein